MSVYFYEPFFSWEDFDRVFSEAVGQSGNQAQARHGGKAGGDRHPNHAMRPFQPRMDIHESPDSDLVTATIELPGMGKQDVSIDVRNGRLFISGEMTTSNDINESGYVLRERRTGKFSRALPLPDGTEPQEIKATMENGVLNVTVPKASREQAPKKINIA